MQRYRQSGTEGTKRLEGITHRSEAEWGVMALNGIRTALEDNASLEALSLYRCRLEVALLDSFKGEVMRAVTEG